jgi:predicted DNA-binding antitoxin AbrB/MazE fold protein
MTTSIQAVYEKGVFRPLDKVALDEGTRVEVLIAKDSAPRNAKDVTARLAAIANAACTTGQSDQTSMDPDAVLYPRVNQP